jgi:N-acetylmuramoyl-L-alanine amidase
MSKYLYILDPGHGGLVGGKYATAGKRSPLFEDGKTILYEGVNNRDNVERIMKSLQASGIRCVDIVNSQEDVPLKERVRRANALFAKEKQCVYISIHSDAACNDGWCDGRGMSVWTSPGQTSSDLFASLFGSAAESYFGTDVKFRKDKRDGDDDHEAHFYVLEKTLMPAVLIEAGFHTHKEEAAFMLTDKFKTALSASVLKAVKNWESIK